MSAALLLALLLPAEKLNVVVILADDLGWADLGCYGSKFHKTPHLDALAKQGLRFTHGYAACPVCSPTRAALMTGKWPARLGITDWLPGRPDRPDQPLSRPALASHLPAGVLTVADHFKKAGYVTGHIGKWHLGGEGHGPTKHGFDVNVAGDHTGTPRSYFAPYRNATGFIPGLEKAPEGEYLTDRLAAEAAGFIDANKGKPFFLYLPHHAVHTPMRAKKELVAKYPGKPAHGRQSHPVYAAMLESLDDAVGRVMKALDDAKVTEKTVVVFTSDNGGLATLEGMPAAPTINAPLREGKGYLYEGGIRVPLIVRWPGVVRPGTTTAVPAVSHDLMPTLLSACGLPAAEADGASLVPLLKEGTPPARDGLYWHYPHYANQGSKPGGAVRDGAYKLIEFYEDGRRELFDVVKDVGENVNLAAKEPARVEALAKKLAAWRAAVGARMPAANPGYRPNPPDVKGVIVLHARTARVHGTMLRFEPLPHKNTLGYWVNADDYATWEFTAPAAGSYRVVVLQGCGTGQGGSTAEVSVGGERLTFTVKDTGGFQAFEARDLGAIKVGAGRQTLKVKPLTKAKAAVMDVREVRLVPVER
ncbi:MAG: sulfatase-like hydrolase/transferase [Gemmataceae bacterium]